MELSIKSQGLDLSDALRSYAERRLSLSLAGFGTHVNGIEVRLADINGPRGGVDKICSITVRLRECGVVFVRAAGESAYATVNRAAARIRTAVVRTLSRRQGNRRRLRRHWMPTRRRTGANHS
jgi:putative sigma-54 modulation protein